MIPNGQLVMLVDTKGRRTIRPLVAGGEFHTQDGILRFDDVAQAGFGGEIPTHLGRMYRVVKPTLHDLIKNVRRSTQIIYPKDVGYICLKLGIGPGTRVIEAGSGSGGLTTALAYFVGDTGKVFTFERRPEFFKLVSENLEAVGLTHRVRQFHHSIAEGFLPDEVKDETDPMLTPLHADALFLDVRTPEPYLEHIPKVVKPGTPLGFLLPTTNQVSELLRAMEDGPFEDIDVLEIFLRRYKPVPDRLRPDDRMVAHTGFLAFARLCSAPRPKPVRERERRKQALEDAESPDAAGSEQDAPGESPEPGTESPAL